MIDVIRLMWAPKGACSSEERACFELGERKGSFSRDFHALLVPRLRVAPSVVRAVSQGSSLFRQLRNVRALHCMARYTRWERGEFTFCWGDFEVFETGRPCVVNAVLMQDVGDTPELSRVMKYVEELKTIEKAV